MKSIADFLQFLTTRSTPVLVERHLDGTTRTCVECQGVMSPVVVMDKDHYGNLGPGPQSLEYRRPEDSRSFWTGKYPTAGRVQAFMCSGCGRITLYGEVPEA